MPVFRISATVLSVGRRRCGEEHRRDDQERGDGDWHHESALHPLGAVVEHLDELCSTPALRCLAWAPRAALPVCGVAAVGWLLRWDGEGHGDEPRRVLGLVWVWRGGVYLRRPANSPGNAPTRPALAAIAVGGGWWRGFRRRPGWVQAVAWLVASPIVISVWLWSLRWPAWARVAAIVVVGLFTLGASGSLGGGGEQTAATTPPPPATSTPSTAPGATTTATTTTKRHHARVVHPPRASEAAQAPSPL